jgi:UDP-glucose 4-epimerase
LDKNLKKAVITGAAGFIGSHLCELLLEKNWQVVGIDNLSTGSLENVSALQKTPEFSFYKACASNKELMLDVLKDADLCFHLAAVVGVKKVIEDPVGTIEINHEITKNILETANESKVRVFITSSSEVYGSNKNEMFHEEDICMIGPTKQMRWSYSASKLMDEFHAFSYFYKHNLPVTIVRLFNTIGPRQIGSYGMVVPSFIDQALTGKPLTVYGTGRQKRSFTYVKDVIKSLYLLSQTNDSIGKVFNIGNSEETSILALATLIKEITDSSSDIEFLNYKDAYGENFIDVERRKPDTNALFSCINYKPETPLNSVLKIMIDNIKE